MGWPSKIDVEAARQRRAAVKAAGGVLDLLLPLRVGGTGLPLFCAHPAVGLSWCYTALLRHVGPEHAIYGLQSRGIRRPEPLPTTMRELAQEFADQVRTAQPAGPYHLLGWSLGGLIAYAVAEELERRGERVALLAMLDAYPHDPRMESGNQVWFLYNIVLADFGYPPVLRAGEPRVEERVLDIIRRRPNGALSDWTDERIHTLLRVTRNNSALATAYRPGRLQCGLVFFCAALTLADLGQSVDSWRPFIGGPVDVHELDCRHQHMMQPATLAQVGTVLTSRLVASRAAPVT